MDMRYIGRLGNTNSVAVSRQYVMRISSDILTCSRRASLVAPRSAYRCLLSCRILNAKVLRKHPKLRLCAVFGSSKSGFTDRSFLLHTSLVAVFLCCYKQSQRLQQARNVHKPCSSLLLFAHLFLKI